MDGEVLISGATGFLGRRLLSDLLSQSDARFCALVRSADAPKLLSNSLPASCLKRIRFLRGDLTQPLLGLTNADISSLAKSITEVWHLAASTSFEESKRDHTFQTNVQGVRNFLTLARRLNKLEVLYYMSTAYVCGRKLDWVPEGPFTVTEGFKNPYEESKYEAEKLMCSSGLPVAILRPSITIGDSKTGDHGNDHRMLYGYFLALLRASMHAFPSPREFWQYWSNGHDNPAHVKDLNARLLVCPEADKNVVTLDDVVSVSLAIRNSASPAGKTYNIVNPRPITCAQIVRACERCLRVTGYRNDPHLTPKAIRHGSIVERAAYRYTRLFWPYSLATEPNWDTRNVDELRTKRVVMCEDLFESMMGHFLNDLSPAQ